MSFLRISTFLIVILLIAGCKRQVISSFNINEYDRVVVKADNQYSLTMPQVFAKLQKSMLMSNGGTLTSGMVKDFIDSIVVDSLAGFRGDDVDISSNYKRNRLYKKRYHEYLLRRYIKEVIFDKVELDSIDVEKYYFDNPELYSIPEQVFLHHIFISKSVLKDEEDSLFYRSLNPEKLNEETSKHVMEIWNMLEDGESFNKVAVQYSHDQLAQKNNGVVGWTAREIYKDPFDSLAFSMKPGTYSNPYKDADGWHIIFVEGRKEEGVPAFDSIAYQDVYQRLFSIKADALALPLIDSLNGEIHLEYNESILDSSVYLVDMPEWVAVLNGIDTVENADLRSLEEQFRKKYNVNSTSPAMKKEMIKKVAMNLIMIQAARARGTDTRLEVVNMKQKLTHNAGKSMVMAENKGDSWSPSEEMIERHFRRNINDYKVDKPLVVQQIIVDDSLFGVFLKDQAMAGVDFLELAQEYYPGEENIRKELANLGEIGPDDVDASFYRAAMLTPVNSVTNPIKTQYGYQVIKVLAKYDESSLVKARNNIIKLLTDNHKRELFHEFRNDLYRSYNVRFIGKIRPVHLKPLKDRINN